MEYTRNDMMLFSGSSHPKLAQAIAQELGVELGKVTLKAFSCGERYVRYEESVRGKEVFLLQTSTDDPDEDLMELFLMCQAAKLSFASRVHVVLPNFPYARQDRVAEPREPISAKLIADLLTTAGADHVITLTLHSDQIQGFFSHPVDALSARDLFVEYFRGKNILNPVVVSPDAGGAKQVKVFADKMGCSLAILNKTRPVHNAAEILHVVGSVAGKTPIIFDDMIDTAGSALSAKRALLKHGASREVYLAATHAILSGPAVERLTKAGFKEVVVTDSIPLTGKRFRGLKVLSIAPMLAEVIGHVAKGESVTAMYK